MTPESVSKAPSGDPQPLTAETDTTRPEAPNEATSGPEGLERRDEALRLNNALAAENDRLRAVNNAFVAQNDALQGEVERLIRERGAALATIASLRTGRP